MNAACIRRWVNIADRLVEEEEKEADAAGEGIVRRKSFRALITVVDEDLEGEGRPEEYCIGDAANPR